MTYYIDSHILCNYNLCGFHNEDINYTNRIKISKKFFNFLLNRKDISKIGENHVRVLSNFNKEPKDVIISYQIEFFIYYLQN